MSILIIRRHGQSRYNALMEEYLKTGNQSLFTDEVLTTPDIEWDLTSVGIAQATLAGQWVNTYILDPTTQIFSSPSPRAISTASIVYPGEKTVIVPELTEQDWGILNRSYPWESKSARRTFDEEARFSPNARPPDGNTFSDVYQAVKDFLVNVLVHHAKNQSAVTSIDCHYSVLRAVRMHLEGIPLKNYAQTFGEEWKSNNCQTAVYYLNYNCSSARKAWIVNPAFPSDLSYWKHF